MDRKWVYFFNEISEVEKYVKGKWDDVKGMLGGKGANLAEMTRIGVPVPPGFTITSEACNTYLSSGEDFPDGMWEQVLKGIKGIEDKSGKKFGDPENPLLVSCRSGAKFSMPGMMDTVLDIGLNDKTAPGMVKLTSNERFVYDSYRRLVQMFGNVVMGVPDELFEEKINEFRIKTGTKIDADFNAKNWKDITKEFKTIIQIQTGSDFPMDPYKQLKMATEAVFKSWNGKRAVDYRNAASISHNLGTAVNIVTMVFGNLGNDCATGVALSRNGSTGENRIEGDYLINAQGEDVVAGTRQTNDISKLKEDMPEAYADFDKIIHKLEKHYKEMQDVEFTIENKKLWMLQTRDGKRTARAAVRIAIEMAEEGLISKEEAVLRITPDNVDSFLHPQFDSNSKAEAKATGSMIAMGLNVSPGAGVGVVAFDADLAESWAKKDGRQVIMVRPETKPDDIHGMLAANGILTSRGGRTSHAALVARQFGKPAVVGVTDIKIDLNKRQMSINGDIIKEGDWISIDGSAGEVYNCKLKTNIPDFMDTWLIKLLSWADEFRRLGIWTNADTPEDAKRARSYGAEGIGLCRTEHMFFEPKRLPFLNKMIMTDLAVERRDALDALLPFQRDDFIGLFKSMNGLPVITRLIDPPLHEFLPNNVDLLHDLTDLKIKLQHAVSLQDFDTILQQIKNKEKILARVDKLHESNPMLGLRGVRLGIQIPELTTMQVRAVFEAACIVKKEGVDVHPEIMIPLTSHFNELKTQRKALETEAKKVMKEQGIEIDYKFGTMIEVPRAALTADQLAEYASFISFGTNDLTQTTFGISRDDAESGFLINYLTKNILTENPFATIDIDGVGKLMEIAVKKAKKVKPDIECGICGEHAGDPKSIEFCHYLGLDYVSCSPFRIPVARLAAAHAALKDKKG